MRQTQEIALSQAYQARADQNIGLILAALESETTQAMHAKWTQDPNAELTPQEFAVAYVLANARLVHWENMHFQYEQGFVSQEHWDTQLATMRSFMRFPEYMGVYESNEEFWRDSFREVLDQILESH